MFLRDRKRVCANFYLHDEVTRPLQGTNEHYFIIKSELSIPILGQRLYYQTNMNNMFQTAMMLLLFSINFAPEE